MGWLHPAPLWPGSEPATQVCALDWESIRQLFGVWANALTTEPHLGTGSEQVKGVRRSLGEGAARTVWFPPLPRT